MKKWTGIDIKALRMQFRLTQAELAKLVGVAPNYIHMMEKEVRKPSKPLMLLLSRIEKELKMKGGK